ncbi:MAG: U32 family peptidase, partial [Varibaculum cambriense]|nr:U32 family peptidase [Varibaculum cambriense]
MHNDNPEYSPSILRRLNPEVLAPAGNLETLKTAIDFGADAVYCGGKAFGMRAAPRNFSLEDFEDATTYAHQRGSRVYVT